MKNVFGVLRSRGVTVKAAAGAALLVATAGAQAALPAWATDIGDDIMQAVTDAAALVGPAIGAALVAIVVITLVKRFVKKV